MNFKQIIEDQNNAYSEGFKAGESFQKHYSDQEFEDWKPLLKFIMEYKLLKQENETLKNQIKNLETQVYGGSTK